LRKIFFLILALLVSSGPALAGELLVVQSLRSPLYDEALKGFKETCPARNRTLVISDYAEVDLARVVREERPSLVLAVGDGALAALRKVRNTPVVSLMALGIGSHEGVPGNLAGVSLSAHPEQYLALFRKLKSRRIGMVYNPVHTEWYVRQARALARQSGVELVTREVHDPRQTIAQLDSLQGKVDAIWMLPDTTAVTRETLEAYFLFSQAQSVPVISFSATHLRLGALAALEVDRTELGRQTGLLALEFLEGETLEAKVAAPRSVSIRVNEAVGRRLNYPAELIHSLFKR